jgi:hypothetical protein
VLLFNAWSVKNKLRTYGGQRQATIVKRTGQVLTQEILANKVNIMVITAVKTQP